MQEAVLILSEGAMYYEFVQYSRLFCFELHGSSSDTGYVHVRWLVSCRIDCQPLGAMPPDSLGNPWLPDTTWGPAGIKFGVEYNEMRLHTVTGSVATGPVTLHLPMSCRSDAEYGVWGFFENGTF
jgi:hypothetical protein